MAAAPGEDGLHDCNGDVLGLEHEVVESWICNEGPDQGRTDPRGIHETVEVHRQ